MRTSNLALAGLLIFILSGLQPAIWAADQSTSPDNSVASEIALIRHRYVMSMLPTDPTAIAQLKAESAKYAAELQPDGTWKDVDYDDAKVGNWKTAVHLQRTLTMAKSARLSRDAGHPNPALESKVIDALANWTEHDYQDQDWWWNQVAVPERLGQIAALILPELPKAQLRLVTHIMWRTSRSNPENRYPPYNHPARWTADNMVSRMHVKIVRGLLNNDAQIVTEAYAGLYREIQIVGPAVEGIQQDYSFHQHGRQLYSGGYGKGYATNIGIFSSFALGTSFQMPRDKWAIFSSYLLDGEQWVIWKGKFDYSTMGREITSPFNPDRLKTFKQMVAAFAENPGPRQNSFEAFSSRLQGKANAPALIGNKQFWCSDFMVDRRKNYYTSVKMLSNRMVNGEEINYSGKKSQHLSDGVNYLYLTGNEYKNIFPVWDWSKLPGTTAVQGILKPGCKTCIRERGTTTFDGGVSDGTYGMAAMDLARGNLVAEKAWFFFGDSYVTLGSGITLSNDSLHPVVTDVNQTLLHGDVSTSESPDPLPTGIHHFDSNHGVWVYHDHVGYILGGKLQFSVSNQPQTGRWSEISTGPSQLVTRSVFDLWIDHGRSPANATYQYIVLPNVTREQVAERAKHPVTAVLSNTQRIQAVYDGTLKLVEIAFRKASSLKTPLGRIGVDQPCLIMVRKTADGWRVSASNPENEALTVKVRIGAKSTSVQLPSGNFAGSSVTVNVPR